MLDRQRKCKKVMRKSVILSEFKESGAGKPSLRPFIASIIDDIEARIFEECLQDDKIWMNVEYKDGWIEIYMTSKGDREVIVTHSGNEHESPTLASTIAGLLPDWYSVQTRAIEEERKEQEFRDYLWRNCRFM